MGFAYFLVARREGLWYNVPMDLFRLEKKDRYLPMKKKIKLLGLVLALGLVFAGCGEKEEAVETVIEAPNGTEDGFIYEASDLIYHLIVLLTSKGMRIETLGEELKKRHK